MATPVQARVQQLLTMGSAEPTQPNMAARPESPTPSPAFAAGPSGAGAAGGAPAASGGSAGGVMAAPGGGTPALGQQKVFGNGNMGQWDGQGWVHVNGGTT